MRLMQERLPTTGALSFFLSVVTWLGLGLILTLTLARTRRGLGRHSLCGDRSR